MGEKWKVKVGSQCGLLGWRVGDVKVGVGDVKVGCCGR